MLPRWSNCNIKKKSLQKLYLLVNRIFYFTSCLLVLRDVSSRAEMVM